MKSRLVILFIMISMAFLGLMARGAYLQLFPHKKLKTLMERQFQTKVTLRSRRGSIYDRNGRELAVSITSYSVYADPSLIEDYNRAARKLSKFLEPSYSTLKKKLMRKSTRFVWLDRQISKEKKDLVAQLGLPGVGFLEEPKRIYPNRHLASHTLGIVGRSGTGLEGIEIAIDKKLQGAAKKFFVKRDARGRPLMMDLHSLEPPKDGEDVYLSLDVELQYMLERELAQALTLHDAESATGVILDAKTSEILSIANIPSFDVNNPFNVPPQYRRNRAIVDTYEPGSTLKTFAIAAALEKGLVKPNTKINCEKGEFKIGRRIIREADVNHKFDELSVSEILAKSSNVGSSKIALMVGDSEYRDFLQKFGFGRRPNINFPGAAQGILRELPWGQHQLANISFGHGITASAIQIAAAYAAIANDGQYRDPSFRVGGWEESKRVISHDVAQQMKFMLMGVTSSGGTGYSARVPGFPVAGKTGTAQMVDLVNGGYKKGEYIASFAGFIPAHDPKYVIYVTFDNPKNKYYGSEVAAPVFSKIAGYAMRKSGVQPILISKRNLLDKKWMNIEAKQEQEPVDTKMRNAMALVEKNTLPQLKGMNLRQALKISSEIKADVKIKGRGRVDYTVPGAGVSLNDDLKEIRIILKE
ncbi:MAG: penicillin-binding transpeptidase domain-containing protein [Bdellovibrionales bacterium]